MRQIPLFLTTALLSIALPAQADLVWEKQRLETAAPAPGTETRVSFNFQNTGSAPLTIESVNASCSCVRTELPKRSLAPGERGTLHAILRTVGLPASRTARIELTTAEAPSRPHRLEIHILQTVPVSLEPAVLWWEHNGALAPQKATLRVPKNSTVQILPLPADSAFDASLEGNTGEEIFRLLVLPKNTTTPADTRLTIEYKTPLATEPERRTLFLKIQP